ncbi:MAG: tryptophan--tRNA ligase, partial [Candidatus Pacearchaeota archaeon]|nr:tryptophan--tRNA ligase [Candidatus Pacearchaeota archaeon]
IIPSVLKKKNIPCLIPLAVDQDPHFRVARDVYPKLGFYKPSIIHGIFLPPLSGISGKMDSSGKGDTEAILTTDSPEEVKNKINKYAFSGGQATIEEHRKKGGNPDVDVSFQYLKMFFEPDDKKLADIEKKYRSGEMLTSELKECLIEKINKFLKKHQQERTKAKRKIDKFIFKVENFPR